MLDSYLSRDDVLSFIKELKTSERYYEKRNSLNIPISYYSYEEALFIFYDALLKYRIIIDDIYLFPEYLDQLDKLYKKLDNFDDIKFGVNKLICKILTIKFDIKNIELEESKDLIIQHIYNKYIKEGYFVHGFSSVYVDEIKVNGFVPEKYENYYDRFREVNKIFEKNNVVNIFSKKFNETSVFFTDDFVLGCYYSIYAPMYFFKFLMNEECFGKIKRKDGCLKDSYSILISPLKRFMSNNLFNDNDKKEILKLVDDEWNLLHRKDKKISLLLVKRKVIGNIDVGLEEFLKDESDIYEIVDRMLNSKNNNISYSDKIDSNDINIVVLDTYYDSDLKKEEKEEEEYNNKESEVNSDYLNKYGSVSYLLLIGSLFITLGVILTIFKVIGG